ncbi:MAG: hypothetical protein HQ508_02745 [Candidatus Marinimicrobia bacterium]|nr:hypothetical protein [Candidatus Neomarinimicrobiota bacterium]
MENNFSDIHEGAQFGNNVSLGKFNIIRNNVIVGDNVQIGNFCVIHENVTIGDDTVVKDYVELRSETYIGKKSYIDSRVSSSGNCKIGNNVTIRYDSIMARGVEVGDGSYICPRVMTNNLNTEKDQIGGAKFGKDCFIGTNAVIQHGLNIGEKVIIGAMSFVNKDCVDGGVYVGMPARKIR